MYVVTMPDGSKWGVPLSLIALNRARYYAIRDGVSEGVSLTEDTIPLFRGDEYEIHDWASNNMNWEDVQKKAVLVKEDDTTDYQEGWVNGDWAIEESTP